MDCDLVVFGDSIQWGQGLKESDKIYTHIKKHIQTKYKTNVKIHVFAHSGAIIGWNTTNSKQPIHGEVPTSYPTIKQQVKEAKKKLNVNDVKFVLIDGGINDVGVKKILNPLKDNSDLKKSIKKYCHDHVKKLLIEITKIFPNSKIIVTGYYRIISKDTSIWPLVALAGILGLALGGPITGVLAAVTLKLAKNEMIGQSNLWAKESKSNLTKAVSEVNTLLKQTRIKFAVPNFKAKNALFADDNWLFGLNGAKPKDPVKKTRECECKKHKNRAPSYCKWASVGHPNKKGAAQYISKILPLV